MIVAVIQSIDPPMISLWTLDLLAPRPAYLQAMDPLTLSSALPILNPHSSRPALSNSFATTRTIFVSDPMIAILQSSGFRPVSLLHFPTALSPPAG
ncbi:hypothetical protein BDV06DRAFT_143667 [Aspergillus oleicola]